MKFMERIIEWMFMIRIAMSPILLATFIGGYLYLTAATVTDEIVAAGIIALGVILGIVFVLHVKKKNTATHFMSRIMASPELDKKKKELE